MSVITNSGLGNQKVGDKQFEYQERKGVTFVIIDGVDWYVRPMERGIGMEDSRRNHIRQMQAALDMDELEYYEPLNEQQFTDSMVDWNKMSHADNPKNPKQRSNKSELEELMGCGLNDLFSNPQVKQVIRDTPKIGRNSKCPCGSGKKLKKCRHVI